MPGPIPVHPSETFAYVLKENRADPESEQVRFRCRTLTGAERNQITDELFGAAVAEDEAATYAATKRAARACVQAALVGWENWFAEGRAVAFPARRSGVLDVLDPQVVTEIGMEIAVRSGLWGDPRTEAALSD